MMLRVGDAVVLIIFGSVRVRQTADAQHANGFALFFIIIFFLFFVFPVEAVGVSSLTSFSFGGAST